MATDLSGADSPFSLTFTIQQSLFPQGTKALIDEAFGNASQFGHTISFFWDWASDDQLSSLIADVKLAQALGFKTVVNMTVNDVPLMDAPPGYAATFASPATSTKYIQDVALLASVNPTYLNIYPEVNLLARYDAPEFANYEKVYPTAYAVAKAASSTTLVGTSMLDVVWEGNHEQGLPDQLGPHDFIGVTTYPFSQFATPADLPADWYSQWRTVYPTSKILFTEVGWGSAAPLSDEAQAQYIAALPAMMAGASPDVIAWSLQYDGAWYNTADLKPFQLQFFQQVGKDPQFLYDQFNADGLFNDDGSPKASYYAAKNLNFNVSSVPQEPLSVSDLLSKPSAQTLGNLVDYDGNHLGDTASWRIIGQAEVRPGDGQEFILMNNDLGRWATLGPDRNGIIDLANYGAGGNTRVVGTYLDPLVARGVVAAGSIADSQKRLTIDLKTGNLASILGSDDYNKDGLQEVYFGLGDHTAFLHAYMQADGNIAYANYQSAGQMHAYLQSFGYGSSTWGSWT